MRLHLPPLGRAWWYVFTAVASIGLGLGVGEFMPPINSTGEMFLYSSAIQISLFVSATALLRFYGERDFAYLFIGMGFLATAALETLGFATALNHEAFSSSPGTLSAHMLGRFAGNNFLSALIFMSWVARRWKAAGRRTRRVDEHAVYIIVGSLTAAIFTSAVLLPLSSGAMSVLHGPAEWAPAVLFSAALIGYLHEGSWRTRTFEHFLVIALTVYLTGNLLHLVFEKIGHEQAFETGHAGNIVGYLIVLCGLLVSTYGVFRTAIGDSARVRAIVDTALDGIITIDESGTILNVNAAAGDIFAYDSDDLVGKNVTMLMSEADAQAHTGGMRRYLLTGISKLIGTHTEVAGRRRDGSIVSLDLAISDLRIGDRHTFVGVCHDITERKKIDLMKNEFVSIVSHELRTPLTSMLGSLGLIRSGSLGVLPGAIQPMIEIAHSNGERLVRLINDILDIQKIESGAVAFRNGPVDALALLVQSVLENESYGRELGVMFDLNSSIETGWIMGDQDRLIQVLTNLLSNAAKFSPEGERVTVGLSRNGGKLRFNVTDRGPGISAADRRRIFEKFAQVDSSDSRRIPGTGLGLSIAKAIVERHGGVIRVDSGAEGGTTFSFELLAIEPPKNAAPDDTGGSIPVAVAQA